MLRDEFHEFVRIGRVRRLRIIHKPLQAGVQRDLLGHELDIPELAVHDLTELLQHRIIRPIRIIGHNRIGFRVQNRS
ncbi:hypothetical protein D3C81_2204620 [compost metagenome]